MNDPIPDHLHLHHESQRVVDHVRQSESTFFNETLRKPWQQLTDCPAPAPTRAELDDAELTSDGVLASILTEAGFSNLEQLRDVPTLAPAVSAVDPVLLRAFNTYHTSMRDHLFKTDKLTLMALEAAQFAQAEANAAPGASADAAAVLAMMASSHDNAKLYAHALQAAQQHTALARILVGGKKRSVGDFFLEFKLAAEGGAA